MALLGCGFWTQPFCVFKFSAEKSNPSLALWSDFTHFILACLVFEGKELSKKANKMIELEERVILKVSVYSELYVWSGIVRKRV